MATNLSQIAQFLDNRDWSYYVEEEKQQILSGVKSDHIDNFFISIRLSENGEFLHLTIPELVKVKDNVFKGLLFQTLLTIQWEVKMLRFQYDPSDGEIRTNIELPLENTDLTEKLFNRILSSSIHLVESVMPRIQQVLATGNDPGKKPLGEELLEAMPSEWVHLLEEAILSRRK